MKARQLIDRALFGPETLKVIGDASCVGTNRKQLRQNFSTSFQTGILRAGLSYKF